MFPRKRSPVHSPEGVINSARLQRELNTERQHRRDVRLQLLDARTQIENTRSALLRERQAVYHLQSELSSTQADQLYERRTAEATARAFEVWPAPVRGRLLDVHGSYRVGAPIWAGDHGADTGTRVP